MLITKTYNQKSKQENKSDLKSLYPEMTTLSFCHHLALFSLSLILLESYMYIRFCPWFLVVWFNLLKLRSEEHFSMLF